MNENIEENQSPRFRPPLLSTRKRENTHGNDCCNIPEAKRVQRINGTDEEYEELVEYVKKNRPFNVIRKEKLNILLLQGKLRHYYYKRCNLVCLGCKPKSVNFTNDCYEQCTTP